MKNVINFFAYGELMNKDIFSQHGLECLARTTVTLSAWKVVFNRVPKEKDSPEGLGLTNIEPTPDSDGMLYGVLYEMDDSFLPRLDEIHNYPEETRITSYNVCYTKLLRPEARPRLSALPY